jgi:ribonuclease III family protein
MQVELPHPKELAHLGDAVYTLWVREMAISKKVSHKHLHDYTSQRVCAETQALLFDELFETLTEPEKALAKRSENVSLSVSKRSKHKIHRKATAFEAIIGYWYLFEPTVLPNRKQWILFQLEAMPE